MAVLIARTATLGEFGFDQFNLRGHTGRFIQLASLESGGECIKLWAVRVIIAGVLGVLALPVLFSTLSLLGFTAGGVAKGSCAAARQRDLGNIVGGSCFAMAQSVAMKGLRGICRLRVLAFMMCLGMGIAIVWGFEVGFDCARYKVGGIIV